VDPPAEVGLGLRLGLVSAAARWYQRGLGRDRVAGLARHADRRGGPVQLLRVGGVCVGGQVLDDRLELGGHLGDGHADDRGVSLVMVASAVTPSPSPFPAIPPAALPGPIPDPNATSTTVISAGNASGLFPEITPGPAPSPAPASHLPAPGRSANPAGRAADASTTAPGTPVLTAQVLGLIALALAFLLAMTRLSLRRRTTRRGPGA